MSGEELYAQDNKNKKGLFQRGPQCITVYIADHDP